MRELNVCEIEEVRGGTLMFALGYAGAGIAVAATTFKAAYDTATFFGADKLGGWLGRRIYSLTH